MSEERERGSEGEVGCEGEASEVRRDRAVERFVLRASSAALRFATSDVTVNDRDPMSRVLHGQDAGGLTNLNLGFLVLVGISRVSQLDAQSPPLCFELTLLSDAEWTRSRRRRLSGWSRTMKQKVTCSVRLESEGVA